ncbi:MAG: hypothetical protein ACYS0I_00180 [Planctomycetota bacterium]|jgi:uncharacterized lipoprotein YajG
MKVFTILRLLLLLGLSLIVGCATPTSIDLIYHTVDADTSPCKSSVAVIALEDQREFEAIGEIKDGQQIYGKPAAAEWISRALLEELKKGGCQGEYHDKGSDFNTDYVVTGAVEEMYFKQESMSGFASEMKLRIVVNKAGQKVLGKGFSSTLRKKTLPGSGAYNKVLNELLQNMLREVVPDVREVVE